MEESTDVEGLQFKWGQKRGIGGKNKDVQFYESFTYDGEDYSLYDNVLICNECHPEPFVGKIIKIWEHTNKSKRVKYPRGVKLLWFFKPSEISRYLGGVTGIQTNELFLASGKGIGLVNVNSLEAISGKCSVVCISKDKRNPQPSDEELKNANFVFFRTFDVGRLKVLDNIDDRIADIDVKFIFNRTACKEKARAVQKVEADSNGHLEPVKPDGPSTSEAFGSRRDDYGVRKGKGNVGHKQMDRQQPVHAEKRLDRVKDTGGRDEGAHGKHDASKDSTSGESGYGGKSGKENGSQKYLARQRPMPAEARSTKYSGLDDRPHNEHDTFEASVSKESGYSGKRIKENDGQKQLIRQKSVLAGERYTNQSGGMDDRPSKKRKLHDSVAISGDRNKEMLQRISFEGVNNTKPVTPLESHSDEVTREKNLFKKPSIDEKKKNLHAFNVAEGKDLKTVTPGFSPPERTATEKGLSKKRSFDDKQSKCPEDKILMDIDYKRKYQVFEVTRRPDAETRRWFREPPWEERMRSAQEQGTLVLLQNLDPTYTSDEVEDLVYSCLNERCATARMIERTAASIPLIGEALVILKTRDAAERVVRRLDDGCLLLSSGRPVVASFPKITPPGKPPPFAGHIKIRTPQIQREKRDAVATSHCSQPNTIEFDMSMEWCLHLATLDISWKKLCKRQKEEREKLRIDFKPKPS